MLVIYQKKPFWVRNGFFILPIKPGKNQP